jgi:hypothetical protein
MTYRRSHYSDTEEYQMSISPKKEKNAESQMKNGHWGIMAHSDDWIEYQNFLEWKNDREKPLNESWQRL